MVNSSFYTDEELPLLGFKSYGKSIKISRFARFYSPEIIEMGDNVRIDDFCIISGKVIIGSHVHISAYVALYGSMGIVMEDYTGISPRSTVFSAMDDFTGENLIGPIHPKEKTNVKGGQVLMKKYSQIGAHSIVFPNLTIGEGAVVGAFSLVNKSLKDWGVYFGSPVKWHKEREHNNAVLK